MALELLLSASLVLTADQLTKVFVTKHLPEGQSVSVGSFLKIRHVTKAGRSQRLVHSRTVLLLLWGLAVGGIVLVLRSGHFFQHPEAQVGLGGAIGGAASNLYGRLRHGAVIDFLDVGWWPVFNLADVAITVGVVVALWFIR